MIYPDAQKLLDTLTRMHIPHLVMSQNRLVDYSSIPNRSMQLAVVEYIELGTIDQGDFLWYFVTNDLRGAFRAADNYNEPLMGRWVNWFSDKAPSVCWGSKENVVEWCKSRAPYYNQYLNALQAAGSTPA